MRTLVLVLLSLSVLAPNGAAAQDEASEAVPEPPPSVELRPVTVRFRTDDAGLRVAYLQDPVLDESGSRLVVRRATPSRYVPLCDAPCDVELPQTHLGLAVSRGEHLHRFDEPLGVDGPTGVRLAWQDHESLRIAGVLTMIFGGVIGLSVGGLTLGFADGDDTAALAGGVSAGAVVLAGAVTFGLFLLFTEDSASFEVTPLPAEGSGLFSSEWR